MGLRALLSKRPILVHSHCFPCSAVDAIRCCQPVLLSASSGSNSYYLSRRTMIQRPGRCTPMLERARNIVPILEPYRYKGQSGRVGVIGGSADYAGAPYFAAISALKLGADIVHVFCPKAVAPIIKTYSPELIVHPLLDEIEPILQMEPWLSRLDIIVIGPGLGRDRRIMNTTEKLIKLCRNLQKPVIIDADGLHLVTQDPGLVRDYYGCILTPNAMEFSRLFGNDRDNIMEEMKKLGQGVTVLEKGHNDWIYAVEKYKCPAGGSARRCGGQGGLLAGVLATFYYWARESEVEVNPQLVACFAASYLTKNCNSYAFKLKGRGMVTGDMIEQIPLVFKDSFEHRME